MNLSLIPNSLTVSRCLLGFWFPWAPVEWRFGIVAVALLTEFLDGFLARKMGAVTRFGQLSDPVADKVFVFCVLGTYLYEGTLGFWPLFGMLVRDITVWIGVIWLVIWREFGTYKKLKPKFSGKVATALQFIFLVNLVYLNEPKDAVLYATIGASIVAGYDYMILFINRKRTLGVTP